MHRTGRRRAAFSVASPFADWSHQTASHALEHEAVDALAQLQGGGNEGGTQWSEEPGESTGTPAARPWRSDAAGKKKINREGDAINVQAAVQQMQTYLMDNSYIKVYKKSDKKHDDGTV